MTGISAEQHLDITIDKNNIIEGVTQVIKSIRPTWPIDQLSFKLFTNGITNKLVGAWYADHYNDMVMVRVYGNKTDLLIDRKAETRNIRILHKVGYTYGIYATFNNGLAYQFLEGDVLTVETVREPEVYRLVAKRLAQMHRLDPNHPEINKDPCIWDKTERFMQIMPKEFSNPDKQAKFERTIKPYAVLEEEYQFLKQKLMKLNNSVVYSHNDLLLANVLYNKKENSVTFIDYEYTAFNYQAYDIANHFAEFAGVDIPDYSLYPKETLQRAWLRIYLQTYNETNNVSEDEVTRLYVHVNKFVLLSHFFWGCWSLIQSQHSFIDFDFLEYAAVRFNEYFKGKDERLKS